MRYILHRYIDGRTHLGMPRGARTLLFDQIQTLPLRMYHHKCKELFDFVSINSQWKIIEDQLPT